MIQELKINNRKSEVSAENSRRIFGFFSFPKGRTLNLKKGSTLVLFLFLLFFSYYPLPTTNYELAEASTLKAPPSALGLVGYWPLNEGSGTIAGDASGNGNTGTLTNGPTWTTGKRGNAVSFDGTNDYVSTSFTPAITTSTFSYWFKPTIVDTNYRAIVQLQNGVPFYGTLFHNGTMEVWSSGDSLLPGLTVSGLTANNWYHYVLVRQGNSITGGVKVYLNGVLQTSANSGTGAEPSALLVIGDQSRFSRYFAGSIDDVRIYNRALSASEINTLYHSGEVKLGATQSTGSLSTGLVGHWTFDGKNITNGRINDVSGQGNHGYAQNIATSTFYVSGQLGQAGNFDGVNDSIIISDANSLDISNSFGISFWFKPSDLSQSQTYLLGKLTNAGGDNAYGVIWEYANNKVQFYSNTTDPGYPAASTDISISDTNWHHIIYNYDGTTFRGYLDGVSAITPVTTSFSLGASTGQLLLADFDNTAGENFKGYLDDIRIYSRSLTTAEIARLYAMGRPTVVKRMDPYASNTSLLLHMNEEDGSTRFVDSSINRKTVSVAGNTQIDTAQSKFGGASGLFDGTGDSLAINSSSDYAFGTGDFTVEFWLKSTDTAGNLITETDSSTNYWATLLFGGSFYWQKSYNASNLYSLSASAILDGNWHHVAASRTGTSHRLFFDGVQQGATVTDSTDYSHASVLTIGTGANGSYAGWLDDIRITKGVARYTSNFTPPTRQFSD